MMFGTGKFSGSMITNMVDENAKSRLGWDDIWHLIGMIFGTQGFSGSLITTPS